MSSAIETPRIVFVNISSFPSRMSVEQPTTKSTSLPNFCNFPMLGNHRGVWARRLLEPDSSALANVPWDRGQRVADLADRRDNVRPVHSTIPSTYSGGFSVVMTKFPI